MSFAPQEDPCFIVYQSIRNNVSFVCLPKDEDEIIAQVLKDPARNYDVDDFERFEVKYPYVGISSRINSWVEG